MQISNEEIRTIFKFFHKLAYPKYVLEKMHSDVRRSFYGETWERPTVERVPTLSVPYTEFSRRIIRPIVG